MSTADLMRPMTAPQLRAHLQRTLRRAMEMDLASLVERLAYGNYKVPSTSRDLAHYVTQAKPSEPLVCTCEAQAHTPLCVHKAAVLIKRWAAEGKEARLNERGDVIVVTEQDATELVGPLATPTPDPSVPTYAGPNAPLTESEARRQGLTTVPPVAQPLDDDELEELLLDLDDV